MMYSKKVMELFRNPPNMGRIKNADGVGKVGNIVCLLPEQKIHVNNDLKQINVISKKDRVLSNDGLYNKINATSSRDYNGKIKTIKNKLGKTSLTPEHLVLALKIPKGDKFLRTKNRKNLIPSWYHAENLRKGDIVLYPILKEEKDQETLSIDIPKPKWDFKSKEIPDKLPLDSDLLRLFGYFLSEGNIQDKQCRTFIMFTLNIKEKDIVDDIKKTAKNLFNLDVVIRERPKVNTVVVYLYSAKLARFFKKLFGNGAQNKSIPDFIMSLPAEKQKSLIYGLWKGDGYFNLGRDGPRGGFVTISYKMAQQIKLLLLRQRIVPSFYEDKETAVRGVRHRKSYRIHIGQRGSLVKLCSILGIRYAPKSYPSVKSWFDNDYLYMPITEIKEQQYNGEVYNLEVENSHSFASEAFCIHNCGDVMFIYIKVKNYRIDDIKFETFGCAAAIATSSMITELAKGKTIAEALKINRKSVAAELGGLPPIKMHCSNLAAEALHEAIYDYLSRKKLPIAKELQKEHGRIKRDLDTIKHRHAH